MPRGASVCCHSVKNSANTPWIEWSFKNGGLLIQTCCTPVAKLEPGATGGAMSL